MKTLLSKKDWSILGLMVQALTPFMFVSALILALGSYAHAFEAYTDPDADTALSDLLLDTNNREGTNRVNYGVSVRFLRNFEIPRQAIDFAGGVTYGGRKNQAFHRQSARPLYDIQTHNGQICMMQLAPTPPVGLVQDAINSINKDRHREFVPESYSFGESEENLRPAVVPAQLMAPVLDVTVVEENFVQVGHYSTSSGMVRETKKSKQNDFAAFMNYIRSLGMTPPVLPGVVSRVDLPPHSTVRALYCASGDSEREMTKNEFNDIARKWGIELMTQSEQRFNNGTVSGEIPKKVVSTKDLKKTYSPTERFVPAGVAFGPFPISVGYESRKSRQITDESFWRTCDGIVKGKIKRQLKGMNNLFDPKESRYAEVFLSGGHNANIRYEDNMTLVTQRPEGTSSSEWNREKAAFDKVNPLEHMAKAGLKFPIQCELAPQDTGDGSQEIIYDHFEKSDKKHCRARADIICWRKGDFRFFDPDQVEEQIDASGREHSTPIENEGTGDASIDEMRERYSGASKV